MFTPLQNFLTIDKEPTVEGLIVTHAKEEPSIGTVTALSDSITTDISPVVVGDRVLFNKFSPLTLKIDGKEITILDISDVYGIITKD